MIKIKTKKRIDDLEEGLLSAIQEIKFLRAVSISVLAPTAEKISNLKKLEDILNNK